MLDMNWPLSDLISALGDQLVQAPVHPDSDLLIAQVRTDSRQVLGGDLFVCLRGERFDAHDFAQQVCDQGAIALVVERRLPVQVPQYVVADTRLALGRLAHAWRNRFELTVMAVVGSNGKTTSKEMLGSVCKAQVGDEAVLVTAGNLNNDIGVPLTLLRLREQHRMAVIELGMNHPGEIDYLSGLVKPDVVLLTNAQREHQEFMKTVLAVALENGSAFSHLSINGTAVFPSGTEFDERWSALSTGAHVHRFGEGGDFSLSTLTHADSVGCAQLQTPVGTVVVRPSFLGRHNNLNAAGASAAAHAAGCSIDAIARGLEQFMPVNGRVQVALKTPALLLINDTYNANPDSVLAANHVLAEQGENTLLILGDMGEVGDQSESFHREVGSHAKACGVGLLYGLGQETRHSVAAFGDGGFHFEHIEELIESTMGTLKQGKWSVLVKGSRFMKMERVVQAIVDQHSKGGSNAS